jgi:hypothetical protein
LLLSWVAIVDTLETLMNKIQMPVDGTGLWSRRKTVVTILDMQVGYRDELDEHGELRVYFDTNHWNTATDGLIYTDCGFKQALCQFLSAHDLDSVAVGYSEAGMQGDNYVSFDVGERFLADWDHKFESVDRLAVITGAAASNKQTGDQPCCTL